MTPAAPGPSQRRFSLAHLVLLVPFVALVIDAWAPIRDNSFLWHIRAGELQANAGEVLVADPFSFTMLGERWLTQSWLAELLYSWGESNWGLGFVPPMMLLLSSITFLGIGIVSYRRSRSEWSTAIIVALTTLLMISFLVPRPVLFSLGPVRPGGRRLGSPGDTVDPPFPVLDLGLGPRELCHRTGIRWPHHHHRERLEGASHGDRGRL